MNRIISAISFLFAFHLAVIVFYSCSETSCDGGNDRINAVSDLKTELFYKRTNDTLRVNEWFDDTVSYDQVVIKFDVAYGGNTLSLVKIPFSAQADTAPVYEQILNMEITSNEEYDSEHPAGTPLNDLFQYKEKTLIRNLDYFISNSLRFNTTIYSLTLGLSAPPKELKSHQFNISLTSQDGTVFNASSIAVLIK